MKLSIIIPIYNTSQYLRKCIDSCINQDISINEYEIILVNDGSTDDSHSICEEYKNKNANIKYIQQENLKQGTARNNGMKIAVGDYIWFVDSDDFIKENCLLEILKILKENKLEILRIGVDIIKEGENKRALNESFFKKIKVTCGYEIIKNAYVLGPPLYIYKKGYLKNNSLSFLEGISFEDNEFTPRALYYADRIGITENIYYFYYQRIGSTTRILKPNLKHCFDLIEVCKNLNMFSQNIEKELQPYIYNKVSSSFNSALNYAIPMDKNDRDTLKKEIKKNRFIFNIMIRSKKLSYKIEGLIFSLFPNSTIEIYKILKSK